MKEFTCKDGTVLARVSRWIKIQHAYDVTPRHALYDYCRDGSGYGPSSPHFDPTGGTYLDYFTHQGRRYATEQFFVLGGPWGGGAPYMFTDTDGKMTVVGAYDSTDYYNPILVELDEYAESVRVYQEIGHIENGRMYYN